MHRTTDSHVDPYESRICCWTESACGATAMLAMQYVLLGLHASCPQQQIAPLLLLEDDHTSASNNNGTIRHHWCWQQPGNVQALAQVALSPAAGAPHRIPMYQHGCTHTNQTHQQRIHYISILQPNHNGNLTCTMQLSAHATFSERCTITMYEVNASHAAPDLNNSTSQCTICKQSACTKNNCFT